MTEIRNTTGAQRAKWREQAGKIASELRKNPPAPKAENGLLKIGIAFDDGMVSIQLDPEKIACLSQAELAEHIYGLVIKRAAEPKNVTKLEDIAKAIAANTADEGKLLEIGWQALRMMVLPLGTSEQQIEDMRMAYFAGAQHLFSSIMGILDPGAEPTDRDMVRMDNISKELDAWREHMNQAVFNQTAPKGTVQ